MTMPHERLRALRWAGELLRDLAHNHSQHQALWGGEVPQALRRQAKAILRHYPQDLELLDVAKWEWDPWPQWIGLDPFDPKNTTGAGSGSSGPVGGP